MKRSIWNINDLLLKSRTCSQLDTFLRVVLSMDLNRNEEIYAFTIHFPIDYSPYLCIMFYPIWILKNLTLSNFYRLSVHVCTGVVVPTRIHVQTTSSCNQLAVIPTSSYSPRSMLFLWGTNTNECNIITVTTLETVWRQAVWNHGQLGFSDAAHLPRLSHVILDHFIVTMSI